MKRIEILTLHEVVSADFVTPLIWSEEWVSEKGYDLGAGILLVHLLKDKCEILTK
jgi:hypothetical protein